MLAHRSVQSMSIPGVRSLACAPVQQAPHCCSTETTVDSRTPSMRTMVQMPHVAPVAVVDDQVDVDPNHSDSQWVAVQLDDHDKLHMRLQRYQRRLAP
eukprot:3203940-Pyramimonas_sp.AAC.1